MGYNETIALPNHNGKAIPPDATGPLCQSPHLHLVLMARYRALPLAASLMLSAWVVGMAADSPDGQPKAIEPVSGTYKFELDIQPIFTARGCNAGACHGKSRGQNGFALSLLGFDSDFDYNSLVKDARGRRVFPSSPEQSLLLRKATGELPHGGGIRIEPNSPDYHALKDWIALGAPRVAATDPKLVGISISPDPHSLSAGATENLTITAHYDSGIARNVTGVSAFQSNEPAIVSVDRGGRLKASQLPGEATIMARYMGRIATWSTAIPRAEAVPPETYAALPRNNAIDGHVWKKLSELNVLPSAAASDATWCRRVYLDAIGRLPTPEEARAFAASNEPNKRGTLIDELLDRPEYADFWANKWADLLRPNPYHVGIKATFTLDSWLRDAFRQNMPYDQFARKILTAQGSTWRNGAVTVFRDRREPSELASNLSQIFLGARLECAKCHQHPFEVYGQKDFYGMAAFFSRIGRKGVGISAPISGGEEMVFVAASGEVRHPITNEVLKPTPLFGKPIDVAAGDDPRAALVEWATSPDHPTFAHVQANRIWAELFGVGIVDPVDDLRATNPPSNPALLNELASEFRRYGFDQKKLLKTIFMSHVYGLGSLPNATNSGDNRNYSRHYRQRLRAETLLDAIADVTQTSVEMDGMPGGTRAMEVWTHRASSDFLDAFGRPDPNQDPPCERTPDATVVQALHLMNAPDLQRKIATDTGRAKTLSASPKAPAEIIDELYLATYSRLPTEDERSALIAEFEKPGTDRKVLVEDLLWSLINSPEFVYKD